MPMMMIDGMPVMDGMSIMDGMLMMTRVARISCIAASKEKRFMTCACAAFSVAEMHYQ